MRLLIRSGMAIIAALVILVVTDAFGFRGRYRNEVWHEVQVWTGLLHKSKTEHAKRTVGHASAPVH